MNSLMTPKRDLPRGVEKAACAVDPETGNSVLVELIGDCVQIRLNPHLFSEAPPEILDYPTSIPFIEICYERLHEYAYIL